MVVVDDDERGDEGRVSYKRGERASLIGKPRQGLYPSSRSSLDARSLAALDAHVPCAVPDSVGFRLDDIAVLLFARARARTVKCDCSWQLLPTADLAATNRAITGPPGNQHGPWWHAR